jgi:maltose alpha-D-glucosyltransferase / alpha-amylase
VQITKTWMPGHGTGTRMFPVAFLKSYLRSARQELFLPKGPDELRLTLDGLLLEKAIYELGYELNNRPTWVRIPLGGIVQTLADQTQIAAV